jgi:hypothetical protein
MYREQAYLLIKVGNEEEAIRILIENSRNVGEAIEAAILFHINDDMFWDQILLKAANNTS